MMLFSVLASPLKISRKSLSSFVLQGDTRGKETVNKRIVSKINDHKRAWACAAVAMKD
jgi:hypothetical protein